jgi:mannitol repressor
MPKRPILRPEHLSEDSQKLFDVLNESEDIAVVTVGAAYVDACLGSLLYGLLLESSITDKLLDVRGGALGTFSARADACYVLGLISKRLHQDLSTIAAIRNRFAHHHLQMDFSDTEVQELCSRLKYVYGPDDSQRLQMQRYMNGPRSQFALTVVMITQRLVLTALTPTRIKERRGW